MSVGRNPGLDSAFAGLVGGEPPRIRTLNLLIKSSISSPEIPRHHWESASLSSLYSLAFRLFGYTVWLHGSSAYQSGPGAPSAAAIACASLPFQKPGKSGNRERRAETPVTARNSCSRFVLWGRFGIGIGPNNRERPPPSCECGRTESRSPARHKRTPRAGYEPAGVAAITEEE